MHLKEAAGKVDLPYPTAARWVRQGMIQPEGYECGANREIRIGKKELRELTILAHLRRTMSWQALRRAAEKLRSWGHNPFSDGKFAVLQDGQELVKICESGEAVKLLQRPGQTLLFPLPEDPTK